MKLTSNSPKFILVTGLPRSATTLVCSLLNSADNAVVLAEPLNCLLTNKIFWPDKTSSTPDQPATIKGEQIIPLLRAYQSPEASPRFDIVGVKEVFQDSPDGSQVLMEYAYKEADLTIVCLRDPVQTIASQHLVLGTAFDECLKLMQRFMAWADAIDRPAVFVRHESICQNATKYLTDVLSPWLTIEGEVTKAPMFGMGDERALASRDISPSPSKGWQLTQGQILQIRQLAGDWFRQRANRPVLPAPTALQSTAPSTSPAQTTASAAQ